MDRVNRYANKFGGKVYKPWLNEPFDYDLAMSRNRSWIDNQIKNGRKIIDIGPDFGRRLKRGGDASPFYEMERTRLKDYTNYHQGFDRQGKIGGVKGLNDG